MKRVIPFNRYRYISIALSVVLILAGFTATVIRGGFNLGIDFAAGINQRVRITGTSAGIDDVRTALVEVSGARIQVVGNPVNQEFGIQVGQETEEDEFGSETAARVEQLLETAFGAGNVQVLQSDYVGPRFSATLANQAFLLSSVALVLILLYIWMRFKFEFALAAIAASVHDVAFMIAFIGAFQIEVSTATIAAILTIIGYSLNDTIVTFDRIRENMTLLREMKDEEMIDTSNTQTLSRTIITNLTTLIAVLSIFIFTTGPVQNFAGNLLVGIFVGTYSSIFIAAPLLLELQRGTKRRRKAIETKKFGTKSPTGVKREASVTAPVDRKQKQISADAAPGSVESPEGEQSSGTAGSQTSRPAHHVQPSRTKKRKKR